MLQTPNNLAQTPEQNPAARNGQLFTSPTLSATGTSATSSLANSATISPVVDAEIESMSPEFSMSRNLRKIFNGVGFLKTLTDIKVYYALGNFVSQKAVA